MRITTSTLSSFPNEKASLRPTASKKEELPWLEAEKVEEKNPLDTAITEVKTYNIAFVPTSNAMRMKFIDLSKEFKRGSDYILKAKADEFGPTSNPHITVVQFKASQEKLDSLWDKIQSSVYATEIELTLDDTKYKPEGDSIWIQLQIKPSKECQEIHEKIVSILEREGITCLNAHGARYDAHLTLSHTKDETLIEKLNTLKIKLKDPKNVYTAHFTLVLGESGYMWQLPVILR
jgi:2'-5' RNA ligase